MKWIAIFAFALTAAAQEHVFVVTDKTEFTFEGKTVTGAPYSAQATTETTQVLPDGNRITRKVSSFIARDSQGRTRREQSMGSVGPWEPSEHNGLVFIYDPIANSHFTLEANSKTAVKTSPNTNQERHKISARLREARVKKEEDEAKAATRLAIKEVPKTVASQESLGTRMIGGVQAEGRRVTETIPAGRIGNERPIEVTNETWYSSELQTVVMSKHSDPRSGDVVYTLTNISRAEPDPSLFAVPADYRVREEQGQRERQ